MRQLISKLTPRGWAMAGGAAAIAIVFLVVVFNFASQTSYATLLTGLDPAQTGKLTTTLDSKGISYQIQNNGTALAVQSDQTAQARVALATAGLLTDGSQPGWSLMDNQPLGTSNFQQQILYERALEGQLDNTIDSIQGVSGAQVNLVMPTQQETLFGAGNTTTTASVLLSGTTSLDPTAIRGIAQLVASSVPGLSSNNVTITDGSGQPLWPNGDSSGGAGGTGTSKQAAEMRYDSTLEGQLNALLTQTLGPGKAQVAVNADLNVDQTTQDTLTYAAKGVPLQQQTQSETLTGPGASTAAGTAGNIPTYAGKPAKNSSSAYKNTTSTTTFGYNKTVVHSIVAPGAVTRQTISVLLDKSVPATELPAIQAAIQNAAGVNTTRGDAIVVNRIAFAKPSALSPPAGALPVPSQYLGYAKYLVLGLGSVMFLFFVTRQLRRREREGFPAEPTWVRELASPRPIAQIGSSPAQPVEVAPLRAPVNVAKKQIEELVERDSDRVAQQVRAWMSED